jgi:hypothetical protein
VACVAHPPAIASHDEKSAARAPKRGEGDDHEARKIRRKEGLPAAEKPSFGMSSKLLALSRLHRSKKLTRRTSGQSDPTCAGRPRVPNRGVVRPIVEGILEELLSRHKGSGYVDLNDIAEVIDARSVTYDEVEHLILRLEAAGLRVGEPAGNKEIELMQAVIGCARRLRLRLRRRPPVDEIAQACGHPVHAVRRALERGASAARPRPFQVK